MDNELRERLSEIETEEIFYGIFIFLIILSYIANEIEKKYFVYRDDSDRRKYYILEIVIFSIVVLINIYYVWRSYVDLVSLREWETYKRKKSVYLNFGASIAALVAGLFLLYIAITDVNIESEISI